ncbi:MAG: TspO/MBR family protein [Pseudomonadota bacterium]
MLLNFAILLIACCVAASMGALFPPDEWYDGVKKAPWNPPNWVFPTVWSLLFLAIAYSAARVSLLPGSGTALALWALQLALNTIWTPIFFGLRRLKLGLIVIVLLWLAVFATCVAFFKLDNVAGLLFIPYIIWVTIAASLNFMVIRLNPGLES